MPETEEVPVPPEAPVAEEILLRPAVKGKACRDVLDHYTQVPPHRMRCKLCTKAWTWAKVEEWARMGDLLKVCRVCVCVCGTVHIAFFPGTKFAR
jgi:hypothetical protein